MTIQLPPGVSLEDIKNTGAFQECWKQTWNNEYYKLNPFISKKSRIDIANAKTLAHCAPRGVEAYLNLNTEGANIDTEYNERSTVALVKIGAGIILVLIAIVLIIRYWRS